jgi:hypothetical protein
MELAKLFHPLSEREFHMFMKQTDEDKSKEVFVWIRKRRYGKAVLYSVGLKKRDIYDPLPEEVVELLDNTARSLGHAVSGIISSKRFYCDVQFLTYEEACNLYYQWSKIIMTVNI